MTELAIDLVGNDKGLRELLKNASKSLQNMGQAARESGQRLEELSRGFDESGESLALSRRGFESFGDAMEEAEEKAAEVLRESEGFFDRFGRSTGKVLEGIQNQFKTTFGEDLSFSLQAGEEAFKSFQETFSKGLEGVLFSVFSGENSKEFRRRISAFTEQLEQAFFQSLAKISSALLQENIFAPVFDQVQKNFLAPVLEGLGKIGSGLSGLLEQAGGAALGWLGEAGKGLLSLIGLSEGGLVKRPTLALVGEAGPELVIPLARLGAEKFLADRIAEPLIEKAVLEAGMDEIGAQVAAEAIAKEAAKKAAAQVGSALAVASEIASFATSARTSADAAKLSVRGGTAALPLLGAPGPIAFFFAAADIARSLAESGVLSRPGKELSHLIFGKGPTPEEKGQANFAAAARRFAALASYQATGVARESSAFDFFGGDYGALDAQVARILGPAALEVLRAGKTAEFFGADLVAGYELALDAYLREFVGTDAAGRFVTGPSLRLIGEAGPEHVLNVDSPASVRALEEGMRPVVRGLFEEERRAGGGVHVHVEIKGTPFVDERQLNGLFDRLDRLRRGRRVFQAG